MSDKNTVNFHNKNQVKNLNTQIAVLNQRLETKMQQIALLKKNISRLQDELYCYKSNVNEDIPSMQISSKSTFLLLSLILGILFLIGVVTGYNLKGCLSHIGL